MTVSLLQFSLTALSGGIMTIGGARMRDWRRRGGYGAGQMGRIGRGWQLTKRSWSVVRQDRSLVAFPIVATIAGLGVIAIFGAGGAALYSDTDSEPAAIVVLVIGAYVLITVSIFCNVAVSACAARALEGHDTTVGEGFAAAREPLRRDSRMGRAPARGRRADQHHPGAAA